MQGGKGAFGPSPSRGNGGPLHSTTRLAGVSIAGAASITAAGAYHRQQASRRDREAGGSVLAPSRILLPPSLVEAFAGAVGEVVQVVILYPLDTIKVRCQAGGMMSSEVLKDLMTSTARKPASLVKSLYAGVWGATLCSILIGAVHFSSYETSKRFLFQRLADASLSGALTLTAAGGAATGREGSSSSIFLESTILDGSGNAERSSSGACRAEGCSGTGSQGCSSSQLQGAPGGAAGSGSFDASSSSSSSNHSSSSRRRGRSRGSSDTPGSQFNSQASSQQQPQPQVGQAHSQPSSQQQLQPHVGQTLSQPSSQQQHVQEAQTHSHTHTFSSQQPHARSDPQHIPQHEHHNHHHLIDDAPDIKGPDKLGVNIVASIVTAIATALVESPVELFRHNQQAGTVQGSFMKEMLLTVRQKGPAGLYWGFLPHCFEALPHDISEMLVMGCMKDLHLDALSPNAKPQHRWMRTVPVEAWDLTAGAASGVAAVIVSMPFDCIKTYMQTHGTSLSGQGLIGSTNLFIQTGRDMVARKGLGCMYYGVVPRLLQQVPSSMMCWWAVHAVVRALQPWTQRDAREFR